MDNVDDSRIEEIEELDIEIDTTDYQHLTNMASKTTPSRWSVEGFES